MDTIHFSQSHLRIIRRSGKHGFSPHVPNLVGGWAYPSEKKDESQLGWWHSQYDGKNNPNVSNHQSDLDRGLSNKGYQPVPQWNNPPSRNVKSCIQIHDGCNQWTSNRYMTPAKTARWFEGWWRLFAPDHSPMWSIGKISGSVESKGKFTAACSHDFHPSIEGLPIGKHFSTKSQGLDAIHDLNWCHPQSATRLASFQIWSIHCKRNCWKLSHSWSIYYQCLAKEE